MYLKAVDFLVKQIEIKGKLSPDDINIAKDIEFQQTNRAVTENRALTKKQAIVKKRTALGELIKWAEYNYLGFDKEAVKVINKAKELLEKEQQDIMDAVDKNIIKRTHYGKSFNAKLTGAEYFRKYFNNKL